jgi:hypothetical protein
LTSVNGTLRGGRFIGGEFVLCEKYLLLWLSWDWWVGVGVEVVKVSGSLVETLKLKKVVKVLVEVEAFEVSWEFYDLSEGLRGFMVHKLIERQKASPTL